jgi:hypothetical protein
MPESLPDPMKTRINNLTLPMLCSSLIFFFFFFYFIFFGLFELRILGELDLRLGLTAAGLVSLSGVLFVLREIRKESERWKFGVPHAILLGYICLAGPVGLALGLHNLNYVTIPPVLLSITSIGFLLAFLDPERLLTRFLVVFLVVGGSIAVIIFYSSVMQALSPFPLWTPSALVNWLGAVYEMILMPVIGLFYIAIAFFKRQVDKIPEEIPGRRIPKRTVVNLFIVLAIIAVSGCILSWATIENPAKNAHHSIYYEVRISSETNLENLTLILPAPAASGSPDPGIDLLPASWYNAPEGWNMSLKNFNGSPVLYIVAPRIVVDCSPRPVAIPERDLQNPTPAGGAHQPPILTVKPIALATQKINSRENPTPVVIIHANGTTVSWNGTGCSPDTPILRPVMFESRNMINRTIDTTNPAGKEPLLYREKIMVPAPCRYPMTGSSRCTDYQSPVYIGYAGNTSSRIEISVSVSGMNEWWDLMGWTSNSYTDRIHVRLDPGEKGWVMAEGNLQAGNGRY